MIAFFSGGGVKSKYAWELIIFNKFRNLSDGLNIFDFKCIWDRYISDHTPRVKFILILFNCTIFEFNIYNIYHEDNELYDS